MSKFHCSIVVPNWNGRVLLEKYLRKIIAVSEGSEIIVCDDASTDDSVNYLTYNFPDIRVLRSTTRRGYASNINYGVSNAHGDIVVLLNTDVVPEKGFLEPLLNHFTDENVFAVGCMDKSYDNGEIILRGRGIGEWKSGFFVHSRGEVNLTDTAWVSGGSGAFRRSMWLKLTGMDPIYNPFYWEDIDLSYRARKLGYTVLFEAKSIVHHYHEEGAIKSDYSKNSVLSIAYRNQLIFCWKYMPNPKQFFLHMIRLAKDLILAIFNGNMYIIIGFLKAILKLPQILIC